LLTHHTSPAAVEGGGFTWCPICNHEAAAFVAWGRHALLSALCSSGLSAHTSNSFSQQPVRLLLCFFQL
jgi:hypothetical protein